MELENWLVYRNSQIDSGKVKCDYWAEKWAGQDDRVAWVSPEEVSTIHQACRYDKNSIHSQTEVDFASSWCDLGS